METTVRVTNPLLNTDDSGYQYYSYGIRLKTNDPAFTIENSMVWRRYSEFVFLRKILKDNTYNGCIQLPDLPTQGLFTNRSRGRFLMERRIGLQIFLKTVLEIDICKSDKALHLFLQTSISTNHILENLLGKRRDNIEIADNVPLFIYEFRTPISKSISSNEVNGNHLLEAGAPPSSSNEPNPKSARRVTFCKDVKITIIERLPKEALYLQRLHLEVQGTFSTKVTESFISLNKKLPYDLRLSAH